MNQQIDECHLTKKIIYINSSNVETTKFMGTNFEFAYDLLDSIRDVVYIKLMKTEVILNPSTSINSVAVADGDPIYISLKRYDRVYVNNQGANMKVFEVIPLNITDKYGLSTVNQNVLFKTEYAGTGCNINDTNMYILDPIEPNLKRVDVVLMDKNFNVIPKTSIKNFTMTLCVYSSKKKITRS